ncbi:acetyl-CoA acyltransferase [Granulicella pectinivorans]|uniref:acetyl-CoA C-acyltransferase n=1 Tax=Granulicella pectinivorans TaxID=474950 RepID=A0A1I6MSM9_9BACT|nr:acetyl-CoA C-acyltransferase [Granulicella pectinivorans]SFS18528.1 acetyl-CoA acyltransferase [Granulicella pectinivorans]
MNEVIIASAVRTAIGKAPRGTLRTTRPDDLAAFAIQGALARIPQLDKAEIEDVILGCAMPEAEQGMNVAKIAAFRAGLPITTSAMTVNRYCASGLQTIALAADRIKGGGGDVILAGGTESMSFVPFGGNKISVNPWLVENYPGSYMSMGLTAERVAAHYGITREAMDQFSYESHQKSLAAQAEGRFDDEIVPIEVVSATPSYDAKGKKSKTKPTTTTFSKDEGPRADTSLEALARLKPVFHAKGTVTAGNSSQTSDGAAAAIVMSRKRADELGIKPLARFVAFAYAGCDPEEMGIGPIYAIPKVLKMAGLTLDDIGVIELNEAFAAQSLAIIKVLGIDPARLNPNGGAIALGHPLGCTGAKLTATLLRDMPRRKAKYGMVTMCVGGGMGAAGIFEAID